MNRILLIFVFALTMPTAHASGGGASLERRVRSEIEYALTSGIAGLSGSVSASRVWIPVTPGLADVFEKESTEQIAAILEQMKKEVIDPKHSKIWSYVSMCQMIFPEKEHAELSSINFPAGREERVVFYKFPLQRWLQPNQKKEPNQTLEPTAPSGRGSS